MIGIQMYTVRDQLTADFEGTVEKIAQIGYKNLEFAGYYNRTPEQVRALLDRLQIVSRSSHIGAQLMRQDPAAQIRIAKTIGQDYITLPSYNFGREGLVGWRKGVAEFNQWGAMCRDAGIKLAYHNHAAEFAPLEGTTGYDVLVKETDPKLVDFELDLYWAKFADQDPVALFAKYPGRFAMWHVKDMVVTGTQKGMTPVGKGTIDFKSIFAQRGSVGDEVLLRRARHAPASIRAARWRARRRATSISANFSGETSHAASLPRSAVGSPHRSRRSSSPPPRRVPPAAAARRAARRIRPAIASGPRASIASAPKSDWIQMFNGKDLSDWDIKFAKHPLGENFNDTFRVEDGMLKVRYDKWTGFNGEFGHIFYKRPFNYYLVAAEYRFNGVQVAGAGPGLAWAIRNNGIMAHGQSAQSMGLNQDFPISLEVQLLGGLGRRQPRTTGNLCTPGTNVHFGDSPHHAPLHQLQVADVRRRPVGARRVPRARRLAHEAHRQRRHRDDLPQAARWGAGRRTTPTPACSCRASRSPAARSRCRRRRRRSTSGRWRC